MGGDFFLVLILEIEKQILRNKRISCKLCGSSVLKMSPDLRSAWLLTFVR